MLPDWSLSLGTQRSTFSDELRMSPPLGPLSWNGSLIGRPLDLKSRDQWLWPRAYPFKHSDTNLTKLKATKNSRIHQRSPKLHCTNLSTWCLLHGRRCENLRRDESQEIHVFFSLRPALSQKHTQSKACQPRAPGYFSEMCGKEFTFPEALLSSRHLIHSFLHRNPNRLLPSSPFLILKMRKQWFGCAEQQWRSLTWRSKVYLK